METKPLLYGLTGFLLGGLLVSLVATTTGSNETNRESGHLAMMDMTNSLRNKTGDEYDKAFIEHMIEHHESAVVMAKLSAANAKHQEIKDLSTDIVTAQEREIAQMRQWQKDWNYEAGSGSGHYQMH